MVDVSAFTTRGFVGSSEYERKKVDLDFDDAGAGLFLTSEMAGRLRVKKGSKVSITLEEDSSQVVDLELAGVGKTIRISDSRVYYAVGREGGAVIRIRKAQLRS